MKGVNTTKVEILLPICLCLLFISYKAAISQVINQPPEIHHRASTGKDLNTYLQDLEFEQKKVNKKLLPKKENSCVGACGKTSNNTNTNQTQNIIDPIKYGVLPSDTDNRVYKWKDKNGVLHVTNNPGAVPQEVRDQIEKEESQQLRKQ